MKLSFTTILGRWRWWLFAAFVLAIVLLAGSHNFGRAGVAKFYADSCLGGWDNSQAAAGEPDQKAAFLGDRLADLFCGGFKGEIPADGRAKKFWLKFVWTIADTRLPATVATTTLVGPSFETKVTEVLDATPNQPVELTITDATSSEPVLETPAPETPPPEPSTPETPPSESAPPADQVPPPAEVPPAENSPTSWWRSLLPLAWATTTEPITIEANTTEVTTATALLDAAKNIVSTDDMLEVFYTLDSSSWHRLGRVSRNNWRDLALELPIDNWSDLSKIQISLRRLSTPDTPITVSLDSLWLEVEYDDPFAADPNAVEIALLPRVVLPDGTIFLTESTNFSAQQTPEFITNQTWLRQQLLLATSTLPAGDMVPAATSTSELNWRFPPWPTTALAAESPRVKVLKTTVSDALGRPVDIEPVVEIGLQTIQFRLPLPVGRAFRPGRYHLQTEILVDRTIVVSGLDFDWGLLALNANRSVYRPNEEAYLQFAALDDGGHTRCDANLNLQISGPDGLANFSTDAGTLIKNETCGPNNVTDEPDYFAHYQVRGLGSYRLTLTDRDNGHSIQDAFLVKADDDLAIERIGATRINPFRAAYRMKLRITARSDFAGSLAETIPTDFKINDPGGGAVTSIEGGQTIAWPIVLAAGETVEKEYEYQAPPVSPKIYLLGPAKLTVGENAEFTEVRQWQIAADTAFTSTQTGNWDVGTTWGGACTSSCVAGTDYPGASDTATIANATTVTVNIDASVSSITINNGGTLTTDNNSRNLTISGTSGTLFTNNGTFTAGNSTVKITPNASITVLAGTFTGASNAFYNLTFSAALATSNKTYTMGVAASTTNNFTISPTADASGRRLTVNLSGGLTVAGQIKLERADSNAAITLSTSASNYPIDAGTIDLENGGTLSCNGSSITLTGTSGTLITRGGSGIFTRGTSTVFLNSDASVTLTSGTFTGGNSFNNLKLTPTLASASRTYTLGSGQVTTIGDMDINPTASSAYVLTVNLGTTLSVGNGGTKTLTITGTNSATSVLDTTGSNYSLVAGLINLASAGTLNLNGSTLTLTGTSGTIFTRAGTFNAGSSTVTMNGDASLTLTSGTATFYNLKFSPSSAAAVTTRTYTLGSGAITVANNLDINPADSNSALHLTVNLGAALTVNATTTITSTDNGFTATSSLDTTSSNYAFSTGSLVTTTISGNANYLVGNASAITVNNNWTNGGTFTPNTSTVTFATATSTAINNGGSGTGHQFYNLTINKSSSATAQVVTNHLDVSNALTVTAGTLDLNGKNILTTTSFTMGSTGTLALQGAETVSFSTNDTAHGTWLYYGDGTGAATVQTIKDFGATDYYNLTINDTSASNQDTFRTNGSLRVANALAVSSATLDISTNSNSLRVDGGLTVNGGTLTATGGSIDANSDVIISSGVLTAPSGTFTAAGNFTYNGGTFTHSSGTVTLDASSGSSKAVIGSITFYNLTFNPTATMTYSITSGSPTVTNTLTIAGSSAVTLNTSTGGVIHATGATISSTNTSTSSGGNVPISIDGTGSQSLTGPSVSCGTGRFPKIKVDKASGTLTLGSNAVSVDADWTYVQGTVDTSTNSSTVCAAPINGGTSNGTLDGQGTSATMSFYNLVIGRKSTSETVTLSGNLVVANDLLIDQTNTLDAGGYNLNVGGNWDSHQGTFIPNGNLTTFDGTGDRTLYTSGSLQDFYNVTVSKSSGSLTLVNDLWVNNDLIVSSATLNLDNYALQTDGTLTLSGGTLNAEDGSVDANGNVVISSGTLSAPAGTMTIGGSYNNSGGTFTANSGSVSFDSDNSGQTLAGTMTGSSAFYNLSFDGFGGGTWTFSNNASSTNNFSYSAGTITAPTLLSVAGSWTRTGGTFSANSGTVELNGANQTVSGASTFYNLKKLDSSNNSTSLTLTFGANATTTISGLLTLVGLDSDDKVLLVSSSPGTYWGLTQNGTYNINWVTVTDSDASLGATITPNNATDGGHNRNWNFGSLTIILDGATEAFGNLTPGGTVVATSSLIRLQTSNNSGFVLTTYRSNSSATMRLISNTSLTIPDKTNWSPGVATTSAGNATASSTEPQTLQFRIRTAGTDTPNYASAWWGTDDTTANALFAGFPSTAKTIVNRSVAAVATTTIQVLYNLAVPETQPNGAYSGDIIYEATVNP